MVFIILRMMKLITGSFTSGAIHIPREQFGEGGGEFHACPQGRQGGGGL